MYPQRMNLVQIGFQKLLNSETEKDDVFKEPVNSWRYDDTVYIYGQINQPVQNRMRPARDGDAAESDGHCVFKNATLSGLGITIEKGDKFVSIAGRSCDYTVTHVAYHAHLRGSSHTVHCYFRDEEGDRTRVR